MEPEGDTAAEAISKTEEGDDATNEGGVDVANNKKVTTTSTSVDEECSTEDETVAIPSSASSSPKMTSKTSASEESQMVIPEADDVVTTEDDEEDDIQLLQSDATATTAASSNAPEATIVSIPPEATDEDDDDDVTSKAALALAAVAAAASAKNKSPAQAAREARAVAQSFISQDNSNNATRPSSSSNDSLTKVALSAVRTNLRQRSLETGSSVLDKLSQGENDSFLQVLLLMEQYQCVDDINESSELKDETDPDQAAAACERLEVILKRVEGAYDSLINILPSKTGSAAAFCLEDDVSESPVVIPDLLPPCAPPNGDPTLAFFRACTGSMTEDGDEESSEAKEALEDVMETLDPTATVSTNDTVPSKQQQQGSVFSSMFKRGSTASTSSSSRGSLGGVFRRKSFRNSNNRSDDATVRTTESDVTISKTTTATQAGEYEVKIEREMLGLTVENVLERTVVRTVAPTGPAKKAGAKVGSLIVKVGNVETRNLTHFETIDELRQSNRPLQLVMRQISEESLRSAREEMGRLIKGAGFGNMMEGNRFKENSSAMDSGNEETAVRPLIEADLRIDAYTNLVRRRFAQARHPIRNKKEEALVKVGEKLVWILTLFVVGLERESKQLYNMAEAGSEPSPQRNPHTTYHHSAKDYADAAKSVSKILLDYTRKTLDPQPPESQTGEQKPPHRAPMAPPVRAGRGRGRGGRAGRRPPMAPGRIANPQGSGPAQEKPLLHIGDVLQRTRTFLADTTSPPAALLRGELISFLCDVLDVDTDMELAEEEGVFATAGRGAGAGGINDLGSAGSLLKLIVLNCPTMQSPCCEEETAKLEGDPDLERELKRRFGTTDEISSDDLHRLHAGNRFLAIVHRLAASRSTSARITACSLGPVLWAHLDFPHQLQLRGVITRALHDVEVMVRKATATVLHEIAELVFDARCVPWLVLMCERSMTDPDPQLRCAAMTLTWHLAEHLPNAFLGDASQGSRYLRRLPSRDDPTFAEVYLLQCKLLPVATRLAEDRSPSVRLSVAAQCDKLCDALGAHWSSVVIDALLALLSDTDERVRCEAVSCVPRLAGIVLLSAFPGETIPSEISILEALIPASTKLQKDKSVSVRASLASAAGDLLTLLVGLQSRTGELSQDGSESHGNKNYKRHVDDRLIPLVQTLLNDTDPEVTSSALRAVTNATRQSASHSRSRHMSTDDDASISSFASHASREKPVFLPVLSEVQVMKLLPTLAELGNSRQWRVRQSAVEIVPALLGCTQKLETRSEIAKLCVRLMSDKVDAVRKTAAECLCMGGSSLGSHGEGASAEWISSIVIPTIRKASIHSDSKQRLLSLKMVEVLLQTGTCPTNWKGENNKEERMTDSPIRELAAIALSLSNDRIVNVRLNVGRCLETVIHVFDDDEVSFIQEVLLQQINAEKSEEGGGDTDVIYFAQRCINKAGKEKTT